MQLIASSLVSPLTSTCQTCLCLVYNFRPLIFPLSLSSVRPPVHLVLVFLYISFHLRPVSGFRLLLLLLISSYRCYYYFSPPGAVRNLLSNRKSSIATNCYYRKHFSWKFNVDRRALFPFFFTVTAKKLSSRLWTWPAADRTCYSLTVLIHGSLYKYIFLLLLFAVVVVVILMASSAKIFYIDSQQSLNSNLLLMASSKKGGDGGIETKQQQQQKLTVPQ